MIKLINILKEIIISNPTPFNEKFVRANFDEIISKTLPPAWNEIKHEFTPESIEVYDWGITIGEGDDIIVLSDNKFKEQTFINIKHIESAVINNKLLYVTYF